MKIEKARYEILDDFSYVFVPDDIGDIPGVQSSHGEYGVRELKILEKIARTCYSSEDLISIDASSAKKLIKSLIERGHEAMLEHRILSVKFICDRAVSHELVRHRLASFAQESQRYCNYSKGKFDSNVTFIQPWWMDEEDDVGYETWKRDCLKAENAYFELLEFGYPPEKARMVLPNCTKTEIVVTANYREWRHILKLRCAKDAHPDMRHLMQGLLTELKASLPVIFDDIQGE